MTIRTLFFVHLAEITGEPAASIDLDANSTVEALLNVLVRQYEGLGPLLPSIAVAVNEKYAGRDHVLQDGDTVALIPPVSGG